MASINKITETLAAIKTVYPYYAKDVNVEYMAKIWQAAFAGYEDNELEGALHMCLRKCKKPPAPADIIEEIELTREMYMPTSEQLWGNYCDAITRASRLVTCFNYTAVTDNGKSQGQIAREKCEEIWESLDKELRLYIGSYGELVRRAYDRAMGESEIKYEQDRFLRSIPEIRRVAQRRESAGSLGYGGGFKRIGE